ncbi:MAG: hypothetical protein IJ809_01955 [Clostridia bacterium]|nr:hypothetical protein [Clostridia bacterium]
MNNGNYVYFVDEKNVCYKFNEKSRKIENKFTMENMEVISNNNISGFYFYKNGTIYEYNFLKDEFDIKYTSIQIEQAKFYKKIGLNFLFMDSNNDVYICNIDTKEILIYHNIVEVYSDENNIYLVTIKSSKEYEVQTYCYSNEL